jgi:hypothetical protein
MSTRMPAAQAHQPQNLIPDTIGSTGGASGGSACREGRPIVRRNTAATGGIRLTSLGTSGNIHQKAASMRRGMTFLTSAHRPTPS